MAKTRILNGVDVGYVMETVEAIKDKPEIAKSKFHIKNKWIDGGRNQSTATSFYGAMKENAHDKPFVLDADEPALLAGTDMGANPVEHFLHALASCLTTTMVYHAAVRGIRVEAVESELEGDLDLRGFLGISDEVRRGYSGIRVKFRVKTDGDIDKLRALCKLSPVYDMASRATDVTITVERMEAAEKKAA